MSVARAATSKQSKPDTVDSGDRPVHAIVCLLLGMLFFVAMDGAAKYLTATMAPEQIIWARFGVVSVFLLPVLWRYRRQRPWVTAMPIAHCLRGLMLVSSSLLFVIALVHLPLEMATAIGFVSPMYVTSSGSRSPASSGRTFTPPQCCSLVSARRTCSRVTR